MRFLGYHKSDLAHLDIDVADMQTLASLDTGSLHGNVSQFMQHRTGSSIGTFLFEGQMALVSDDRLRKLIMDTIGKLNGTAVNTASFLELKHNMQQVVPVFNLDTNHTPHRHHLPRHQHTFSQCRPFHKLSCS